MNWAPYAVYNPQLWHWPETWPLVSLSPTVEPFLVDRLRRSSTSARTSRPSGSCAAPGAAGRSTPSSGGTRCSAWRRSSSPIGFVIDAMLEISLVRTGFYIYSQVIPFGSLFVGDAVPVPADLGVA